MVASWVVSMSRIGFELTLHCTAVSWTELHFHDHSEWLPLTRCVYSEPFQLHRVSALRRRSTALATTYYWPYWRRSCTSRPMARRRRLLLAYTDHTCRITCCCSWNELGHTVKGCWPIVTTSKLTSHLWMA